MSDYIKVILVLVAFAIGSYAVVSFLIDSSMSWLAVLVSAICVGVGFYGFFKAARLLMASSAKSGGKDTTTT